MGGPGMTTWFPEGISQSQMTAMGEGGSKFSKIWLRGIWMPPFRAFDKLCQPSEKVHSFKYRVVHL